MDGWLYLHHPPPVYRDKYLHPILAVAMKILMSDAVHVIHLYDIVEARSDEMDTQRVHNAANDHQTRVIITTESKRQGVVDEQQHSILLVIEHCRSLSIPSASKKKSESLLQLFSSEAKKQKKKISALSTLSFMFQHPIIETVHHRLIGMFHKHSRWHY